MPRISKSSGGGAVWGGVTGNLPDQTDLDSALADKVDVDGAKVLSDVNFTSTKDSKLTLIEDNATADQTDAEIATAYNNEVGIVSQVDAEAGTSTTAERWTPERVKQAIDALGGGGGAGWTTKKVTMDVLAGNTTDVVATTLSLTLDANSTYIIKGLTVVDNGNDAYGVISKVKFSSAVSGYFIPNEAEGVDSNVVSQQSYSGSLTSKTLIEAPTTTTAVARGSYSAGHTLVIETGGSGSTMTFTIALGFSGIGKYAYMRKGSFYDYKKVS